jgi:tRNA G26 N,N-dimethylase Trm1
MGVRAMGNEFKAETWKVTLSTMESSAIKDIMANFETQAKNNIPNGRQTDANAGMGVKVSPPDEAFKVGK